MLHLQYYRRLGYYKEALLFNPGGLKLIVTVEWTACQGQSENVRKSEENTGCCEGIYSGPWLQYIQAGDGLQKMTEQQFVRTSHCYHLLHFYHLTHFFVSVCVIVWEIQ